MFLSIIHNSFFLDCQESTLNEISHIYTDDEKDEENSEDGIQINSSTSSEKFHYCYFCPGGKNNNNFNLLTYKL